MSTKGEAAEVCGYVPYLDEGEGFNDDDLLLCYRFREVNEKIILTALDGVPCDGESTFTVGDYATGDGNSSMDTLTKIIKILRKRYGDEMPIQVLYEDQPMNDYKSLVRRITGTLANAPPSFVNESTNVYPIISPLNFYKVCVPPGSLDLGFSLSSMHYLSKLPCNITRGTHTVHVSDPGEKELIRRHAAQEWESMILKRGIELKRGGHFVITAIIIDDQGRYSGNYTTKVNFFENLKQLWQQMCDEGMITEEEFLNTNSLHYHRTEKEYKAPFEDKNSPVYKMGLRVVSWETCVVRCPYHEQWTKSYKINKADIVLRREHARRFVSSIRYWNHWVFLSGLSAQRPLSERKHIVDVFFNDWRTK